MTEKECEDKVSKMNIEEVKSYFDPSYEEHTDAEEYRQMLIGMLERNGG